MNPDHWLGYACAGLLAFIIIAPLVDWWRHRNDKEPPFGL